VAKILIQELKYYNAEVIAAALLHDVLEDSDLITAEVIKYNFSPYIAYLVEVLTKNIHLQGLLRQQEADQYIERLRYSSIDCKIIKFTSRLDNYRCLEFGVKRNPFRYVEETETLYYPMASHEPHRLMAYLISEMNKVKGKLLA
jgi:(p)ppGpp synthase/HD superfamily hydrolase